MIVSVIILITWSKNQKMTSVVRKRGRSREEEEGFQRAEAVATNIHRVSTAQDM